MTLCTRCSQFVRPVVVSDIDGTLGDYHNAFKVFCGQYWQQGMPREAWDGKGEFEDYLGLTKEEYRAAKLAYRQGGSKRWMPILFGAKEFCDAVKDAGAELWLATTRPWQRLDNVDPDTRFWLANNGIKYDGLLYGEDKYEQIIEAVDPDRIVAVIDDLPENFHRAQQLGLPFILRNQPHNARYWIEPRGPMSSIQDMVLERIKGWKISVR
jgi:hypothetical protein